MIALTVLTLVLAVLVLVCLLALVDQYRTLELIREHLGVNDTPRPIDHPRGRVVPSEVGLPPELDARPHLVVLFLSTSCSTCKTVATALRGKDVPALHVVLKTHSEVAGAEWCREAGLAPERVTFDTTGRVAAALGTDITPAAYVIRDEAVLLAQTIPSYRQLEPLLTGRGLTFSKPAGAGVTQPVTLRAAPIRPGAAPPATSDHRAHPRPATPTAQEH